MSVSTDPSRIDEGRVDKGGPSPAPRPLETVPNLSKASRKSHSAENGSSKQSKQRTALTKKRFALVGLLIVAATLVIATIATVAEDIGTPDQPLVYYEVARGPMSITVTERGNLQSQANVEVFCEVDDINGDGVHGTAILWIVENGKSVKKGDLLVELDVAGHQEQLDEQILETEEERSVNIQAQAKYANQITQNETAAANAELDVKLAELDLEMFLDEEAGTFKLERDELERTLEDTDSLVLAAQANMELKKNDLEGIQRLFSAGYAGKNEVEEARLDFLQAESELAAKLNRRDTHQATLKQKDDYDRKKQLLTLQGALDTAKRSEKQVAQDNEALLEQARAKRDAAAESLKKEEERLKRYRTQVERCKIYAPQDGMVAYTVNDRHWEEEIREGAPVLPRQQILSLPNLESMQVNTSVHESVLDQVHAGLKATIRVDAFPDRHYKATVKSVAVLPNQRGWSSSDTKVYDTIVTIDDKVSQLKPGMTAVVEIHVDRLENVLSVPVQAIMQIENETWCYVDNGGRPERRKVTLGRTNDKFVVVTKGLAEGDKVVLNPMAIPGETQKDEPGDEGETPEDSDESSGAEQPVAEAAVPAADA